MDERFDESYLNADELPELTPSERAVMEAADMIPVLGTMEERLRVAMNAAIRFMRERNDLRKLVDAQEELLACYRMYRHPELSVLHELTTTTKSAKNPSTRPQCIDSSDELPYNAAQMKRGSEVKQMTRKQSKHLEHRGHQYAVHYTYGEGDRVRCELRYVHPNGDWGDENTIPDGDGWGDEESDAMAEAIRDLDGR